MRRILLFLLLGTLIYTKPALAEKEVTPCTVIPGTTSCQPVTPTAPLPIYLPLGY